MKPIDINKLKISFYENSAEMPIKNLKTEITDDILNGCVIVPLDINKVISKIDGGQIQYKKFILDANMICLTEFIDAGNKLIPPLIIYISKNKWTILDGQHRIALFLHLEMSNVPFLIRKEHLKFITELQ